MVLLYHNHEFFNFGSDTSIPDSWCFVVLGERYNGGHGSTMAFIGWRAGLVQYDKSHPHCWGTFLHGSDQAEREALLWASLWRCSVGHCLPTTFVSDSLNTLDLCQGHSAPVPQEPTSTLLRSLFQCLFHGLGHQYLSTHHTFGHSGDTWNELTDALAAFARQHPRVPDWDIDLNDYIPNISFWWMATSNGDPTMGLTTAGFSVPAPELPLPNVPPTVDPAPTPASKLVLSPSFASANVNSLFTGEDGFSGKLAYLTEQFIETKLVFVGVQEARTQKGFARTKGYLRFCSGCEQGSLGAELWVSSEIPYGWASSTPLFLTREHCTVVEITSRLLLAHIVAPGLDLWILVGHAPHAGRTSDEIQNWWDYVNGVLAKYDTRDNLVVLLDANAARGPSNGSTVLHRGTIASSSTAHLLDLATSHNLVIAGSLPVHYGTHFTWTSPDGNARRDLDHVLLSAPLSTCCQWSSVLADIDLAGGHHDHDAIAAQCCWTHPDNG